MNRTFTVNNDAVFTAQIFASDSDFEARNNLTFYGSALFRTMVFKNNTNLFFDERLTETGTIGAGIGVVR